MGSYDLGIVKLTEGSCGKGLVLKRELSLEECKYILSDILGIELYTREDFDDSEEYQEQMDEYKDTVNSWLKGDCEDNAISDFYQSYENEPLMCMNIVLIIDFLRKKKILEG